MREGRKGKRRGKWGGSVYDRNGSLSSQQKFFSGI